MRMQMILGGIALVFLGGVLAGLYQVSGGKAGLKQAVARRLIKQELVPTVLSGESSHAEGRVIYVLGGAGDGLRRRFARAAELYKQGLSRKILIKSDDYLMGYDPSIGRNPSHDEWAKGVLAGFGVKEEDIEVVEVEGGSLGTFLEAKTLTNVASRRGFASLILVSSDYHTARVWYIFSKFMRGKNVNLYIYPAREDHGAYMLLHELIKLACYRIFF